MNTRKTKDFGLASYLIAMNCDLTGYTTDSLGQLWFEFNPGQGIEALEQGFYGNSVAVRPQDYLAAQKMLKAIIFETKRNIYEHRIGKRSSRSDDCAV